jgi:hypothetical protein
MMDHDEVKDEVIQTDHPLNGTQKNTLDALLKLIIPASEDEKMPSAAEVGFLEYLVHAEPDFIPRLKLSLDAIMDAAKPAHDKPFSEIDEPEQEILVNQLRRSQGKFFDWLTNLVFICYYQHDRVMVGIGLEPRPPFPKGNQVDDGDLSLLEPVSQRGRIWRKV